MKTSKNTKSPKASLLRDALKTAGIKSIFTAATDKTDAIFNFKHPKLQNYYIQVLEGPAYEKSPEHYLLYLNILDEEGKFVETQSLTSFNDKKTLAYEKVVKRLNKIILEQEKLDESNEAQVSEKTSEKKEKKQITDKKDLKYNYPADVDDLSKRKQFRTKVRGMFNKLDKEILKLKDSKNKEDMQLLAEKEKTRETYAKKYLAKVNS